MKKTILISIATAAFAVLMVFNITTTMNSTTDSNANVSLSGLVAMAQSGGEDCGSGNMVTCYSSFEQCEWFDSCGDYYDCGPCTTKEADHPYDPSSTCEYCP